MAGLRRLLITSVTVGVIVCGLGMRFGTGTAHANGPESAHADGAPPLGQWDGYGGGGRGGGGHGGSGSGDTRAGSFGVRLSYGQSGGYGGYGWYGQAGDYGATGWGGYGEISGNPQNMLSCTSGQCGYRDSSGNWSATQNYWFPFDFRVYTGDAWQYCTWSGGYGWYLNGNELPGAFCS
jgi:hypothetical protein